MLLSRGLDRGWSFGSSERGIDTSCPYLVAWVWQGEVSALRC